MNVYEQCPQLSSDRFLLRQTGFEDCDDLLAVYSDKAAVPIFNSDNCTGDFYITTEKDMRNMIDFWLREYALGYYVRWSIIDRRTDHAVGTIELFNRKAEDFFNNVGLLRLDLRSDYENEEDIVCILNIILPRTCELFGCGAIATKAPSCAQSRIAVLESMGFHYREEQLYGHDGRAYGDYYLLEK